MLLLIYDSYQINQSGEKKDMKKSILMILLVTLVMNLGMLSYAQVSASEEFNVDEAFSKSLELSLLFTVDEEGYMVVDREEIMEKAKELGVPERVPNAILESTEKINQYMLENNLMMNEEGVIFSRDIEKVNVEYNNEVTVSPRDVMYPIAQGTWHIGNNIYRTYYNATKTQQMINIAKISGDISQVISFIPISWFFNALVGLFSWATTSLSHAIETQFIQSNRHGVYNEYWRYNTSNTTWGPWRLGDLAPNSWSQIR